MDERQFMSLPDGTELRTDDRDNLWRKIEGVTVIDRNGQVVGFKEVAHAKYYRLPSDPVFPVFPVSPKAPEKPKVKPGDWLNSLTSAERKEVALYRGLFAYFPDALAAVARHSVRSNEKHNPGTEPHWAREKSKDHTDCIARHLLGVGGFDEGQRHSVGLAWRALANLQLEIEAAHAAGEKV